MKQQSQSAPTTSSDLLQPVGGLHTDSNPLKQPENTIRFALNAIRSSSSDDLNSLSREPGTLSAAEVPTGYTVIGSILLDNNDVVIFSTDNTNSEIGLFTGASYTTLINDTCLNFNTANPITGEFRMRNGCERYVYWVDGLNDDKYLNLDDLEKYGSPGNWDCQLMSLTPAYTLPDYYLDNVRNSGGSLSVGSYQFCFRYVGKDLNTTEWFLHTNSIPIVDENYNTQYEKIDGAYDATTSSELSGGVPKTSKAIEFHLDNTDQSYAYIDIAVIIYKAGDGRTTDCYIIDRIENSSGQLNYLFASIPDDAVSTVIGELTQVNAKWTKSKVITQFDNRLIRANVQEPVIDHAALQSIANNIQVEYGTKDSYVKDISEYTAKNPTTYEYSLSFMRDEVYDLAIVFQFEGGYESPPYHIPGREKDKAHDGQPINGTPPTSIIALNTDPNYHNRPAPHSNLGWDSSTIASGQDHNTYHLDAGVAGTNYERWQVYNTALRTAVNTGGYVTRGELAYYESDLRYPSVTDCDGNAIYPEETPGTPAKIRFHKMPDATLEPHYIGWTNGYYVNTAQESDWDSIYGGSDYDARLFRLHLILSNIDYSSQSNIIGYRIVHKRMNTISSKGYFLNGTDTVEDAYKVYDTVDQNSIAWGFYSAETYFKKENILADHFKIEREYWGKSLVSSSATPEDPDGSPLNNVVYMSYMTETGTTRGAGVGDSVTWGNITPYDNKYVGYNETTLFDTSTGPVEIWNHFANAKNIIITYPDTFDGPANQHLKNYNTNISDYNHYSIGFYVAAKNNVTNLDLAQVYYATHTNLRTATSTEITGDTIISQMNFERFSILQGTTSNNDSVFTTAFVESPINAELRHGSLIDETTHYWGRYGDDVAHSFDAIRVPKNPLYNMDYSVIHRPRVYVPLDKQYEYCNDCPGYFPNRIVYSEVAASEGVTDNYLNFFVNNTHDVEGHAGEIRNIFSKGRSMFVQTDKSIIQLAPNARSLETSEDTVYVGTGNLFSIPGQELLRTDYGYGGCQHRLATKATEFGIFWVDQFNGKVYNFNSQMSVLSDMGMRNWFRENLPSVLKKEMKQKGINYTKEDSITDPYGIGVMVTFDPRFNRVVITKKDYKPKDPWSKYISGTSLGGDFVFDEASQKFYIVAIGGALGSAIPFSDKDYFEDRSWTISYSTIYNSFTSFHSYRPTYMFNTDEAFYSCIDKNLYKHLDKGAYCNFYDSSHDFIVEYIVNGGATNTLESVQWTSYVEKFDGTKNNWVDVDNDTFTKVLAYNSDQCTGLLNTVVKNRTDTYSQKWSNTETVVERTDNTWKCSSFRDKVSHRNNAFLSSDWDDIKPSFGSRAGYIDKVVNTSVIDDNISQYNLSPLRDKFHHIRLFYDGSSQNRLTLDITNTVTKHSFR